MIGGDWNQPVLTVTFTAKHIIGIAVLVITALLCPVVCKVDKHLERGPKNNR